MKNKLKKKSKKVIKKKEKEEERSEVIGLHTTEVKKKIQKIQILYFCLDFWNCLVHFMFNCTLLSSLAHFAGGEPLMVWRKPVKPYQ